MIAIGGGGYVPARILRSFLKQPGAPNIPIQAIGLSLYESLPTTADSPVEAPGTKVTRTQWLDLSAIGSMSNLVGKKVLIVDEVDDTRTTLEYAVRELEKDVEEARLAMGKPESERTQFCVFVLHVRCLSSPLPIFVRETPELLTRPPAEQRQDQERPPAQSHGGGGPVHGGAHRSRRLDMLPVGSDRHRGA
jgi:hypothetical protein